MYLYVERFKNKLMQSLKVMAVTDERMLAWFRTSYMRHMRLKTESHRPMFIGAQAGGPHHLNLPWSEAPQGMLDALMRDEPIFNLDQNHVNGVILKTLVRAMDQILIDKPNTQAFTSWSYTALYKKGELLIKQDSKKAMLKDAAENMIELQAGDEYSLVGLFSHGALDYVGHDLLNCLRDEYEDRSGSYLRKDRGITYIGLKHNATGKFASIAEVQFVEAHPDNTTTSLPRHYSVVNHTAVSNMGPNHAEATALRELLNAFWAERKEGQTVTGPRSVKRFIQHNGKATLEECDRIDFHLLKPRVAQTGEVTFKLYPHQQAASDPHFSHFAYTIGRRTGKTTMTWDLLEEYVMNFNGAPGQLEPIVDIGIGRPPEVRGKRQNRTMEILKHRTHQRNAQFTVNPLLMRMTERLKQTFERHGSNLLMTPNQTRIGSAEAAGIIGADADKEGDRRPDSSLSQFSGEAPALLRGELGTMYGVTIRSDAFRHVRGLHV